MVPTWSPVLSSEGALIYYLVYKNACREKLSSKWFLEGFAGPGKSSVAAAVGIRPRQNRTECSSIDYCREITTNCNVQDLTLLAIEGAVSHGR